MKRLMTICLTAVLFGTGSAWAQYSGGTGEPNSPYIISTVADWQELMVASGDWGKNFLLTADIDLAGVSLTPVGNSGTNFMGVVDGNSHVIRNAIINLPNSVDAVGLFGYVGPSGQINNLGIKDANITGNDAVGGLVGYNFAGSMSACYATGSVSGQDNVGGLVGDNNDGGSVTSCYAISSVNGIEYVGGLVGQNENGSFVTACYATGSVSGQDNVGGLVGDNNEGSVTSCYAIGSVNGIEYVGGLVGWNTGSVDSSFWNIQTSGQSASYGGIGETTAEMKMVSTFSVAGWGAYGWVMADGVDYPRLNWEGTGYPAIPGVIIPLKGSGTQADPYQIWTPADFAVLSLIPAINNTHILLISDIDVAGKTLSQIGNEDSPFTGVFDGNNHVIYNATMNIPAGGYVGLFGYVGSGGQIKNLGVKDANIIGSVYVGGLVGYNYYGSMTSCYATGSVSGQDYVGGLVGYYFAGSMNASYATGSVSGQEDVGGLVGVNESNVTSCYATGSVSGQVSVGGLVGYNLTAMVTSCYATGAVTGTSYIGGLAGEVDSYGNVSVTACYATGSVSGIEYVGGLVGWSDFLNTEVSLSFWDTQTSGQNDSGGGRGLTTAQMKTLSTFRNAGWGAYGWVMADGVDYPRLNWEGTGYPAIPGVIIPLKGSGTQVDPYQIWTPADFAVLNSIPAINNTHILLMNDIDVAGETLYPIGDYISPFTGVFDGNNHTIRNAVINLPSRSYVGLFGDVGSGGQIKNLGVKDANIIGSLYVGSLVGRNTLGSVTACYATGSVTGQSEVGGITGLNDSNVASCYATGSVTGTSYVGGLVGKNYGGVTACYATGLVTGSGDNIGGLVGATMSYSSVTSSFWDMDTSGQSTSSGGTGETTAEMQTKSTFTDAGWDFATVWAICEGTNYPRLQWQIPATDWVCPDGVNIEDLSYFAGWWLEDDCDSSNNNCGGADMDASGSVDFLDYALFASHWLEGVTQ